MLTHLSDLLKRITKGWLIFILAILDGLFMLFILTLGQALMGSDAKPANLLDLQFFYTPAQAHEMLASFGSNLLLYRNFELTADIIYPIVYTLFYSLLITRLLQKGFPASHKIQRLNIMPFGAWLFDLLENIGIVTMIWLFPSAPDALAWATTFFTMAKWSFAALSILLLLISLIAAVASMFRKK